MQSLTSSPFGVAGHLLVNLLVCPELRSCDDSAIRALLAKVGAAQNRIWRLGMEGVGTDREFANFMLPPLNDVIHINSEHLYAARRDLGATG